MFVAKITIFELFAKNGHSIPPQRIKVSIDKMPITICLIIV